MRRPWFGVALLGLVGCGGSGGGGPRPTTGVKPSIQIEWPTLSSQIGSPGTARSARVTLEGAADQGKDLTFVVERPSNSSGTQSHVAPTVALTTQARVRVVFFTEPNGAGFPVANAQAIARVQPDGGLTREDGTSLGPVVVGARTARLEVPDQIVGFELTVPPLYTAFDEQNRWVAVLPNSESVTMTGDPNLLRVNENRTLTGLGAGTVTITVGVDGLTQSASVAVPPYDNPAVETLQVSPRRMAYHAGRRTLLATVDRLDPHNPDRLVEIDPVTATIRQSMLAGDAPETIAIADDGRALYVGSATKSTVTRMDLPLASVVSSFSLGASMFGPLRANDIAVQPGRPQTVVVSLRRDQVVPHHGGVAAFDDGVPRPLRTDEHTGASVIEWGENGSTLYGYNQETSEFGVRRLRLQADGVVEQEVVSDVLDRFGNDILYHGGRLYSANGEIASTTPIRRLGVIPYDGLQRWFLAYDPPRNRCYSVRTKTNVPRNWELATFDTRTFAEIEAKPLRGLSGTPQGVAFAGPNRLAIVMDNGNLDLVDVSKL